MSPEAAAQYAECKHKFIKENWRDEEYEISESNGFECANFLFYVGERGWYDNCCIELLFNTILMGWLLGVARNSKTDHKEVVVQK